jgi:hypothetical protein
MEKKKPQKAEDSELDKKIKKFAPVIAVIAALIVAYFLFSWIFASYGRVSYGGLTFTKEKFGTIPVYHYSYFLNSPSGALVEYNLYIRNNPAENKVPVNIKGKIFYIEGGIVYIGVNGTELTNCNQSSIALATLSQFLTNNFIKIKGGTLDYNESRTENITYVSCDQHTGSTVIRIKAANETAITNRETNVVNQKNCYTINVANCEILPAVEKFIVHSIIDAKNESA